VSKESQDISPATTTTQTSPTSTPILMNSSDNLLYNLSYLSSVIHPVIILRLLEHRLFTPLFKKKAVTSNPPINLNLPPPPSTIPSANTTVENKTPSISVTPNIGALASIPTLPKPDVFKRQRSSLTKDTPSNDRSSLLTKFTHSTYDKHRKSSKSPTSNPITALTLTNSPSSTTNLSNVSTGGTTANDLSSLLSSSSTSAPSTSLSASGSTTNNTNQSRKWFWRNSEKTIPSNLPADRNPLLQAIVETDTLSSLNNSSSITNSAANSAGVGEIKLFEKELLNLPSFQLSDSQNPLLPSPTCLNYDFTSSLDTTNPHIKPIYIKGQQTNGLVKSKNNDEDRKFIIHNKQKKKIC